MLAYVLFILLGYMFMEKEHGFLLHLTYHIRWKTHTDYILTVNYTAIMYFFVDKIGI